MTPAERQTVIDAQNEAFEAWLYPPLHDPYKPKYKQFLVDIAYAAWQAATLAERERCALIAATPVQGEQDDITMAAKDRVAAAIRKG